MFLANWLIEGAVGQYWPTNIPLIPWRMKQTDLTEPVSEEPGTSASSRDFLEGDGKGRGYSKGLLQRKHLHLF